MGKNKIQRIRELGFTFVYNAYSQLVVNKVFRKHVFPPLRAFSSFTLELDPNMILQKVIGKQVTSNIENEFKSLNEIILDRYKKVTLHYPYNFRVEHNTSFLIYSLIRLLKPNKVVETGVANGHSTFFILNALMKNGNGSLYSIDIRDDVGGLITEELKQYWNLYVLPRTNEKALNQYIEKIAPVDVFIHDSNHMYYWQMLEYRSFLKNISDSGFILSDDVDESYAFIDFCNENKLEPFFLCDTRKIFGLTKI